MWGFCFIHKIMKTFNHVRPDTSICIHKVDGDILTGNFFKEKPSVGDFIKSFSYGAHGMKYEVTEVISQTDATVQSECTHDPSNAKMELRVAVVLDN